MSRAKPTCFIRLITLLISFTQITEARMISYDAMTSVGWRDSFRCYSVRNGQTSLASLKDTLINLILKPAIALGGLSYVTKPFLKEIFFKSLGFFTHAIGLAEQLG